MNTTVQWENKESSRRSSHHHSNTPVPEAIMYLTERVETINRLMQENKFTMETEKECAISSTIFQTLITFTNEVNSLNTIVIPQTASYFKNRIAESNPPCFMMELAICENFDRFFDPNAILDWNRFFRYANRIEISLLSVEDPVTRHLIRSANRALEREKQICSLFLNPAVMTTKAVLNPNILLSMLQLGLIEFKFVKETCMLIDLIIPLNKAYGPELLERKTPSEDLRQEGSHDKDQYRRGEGGKPRTSIASRNSDKQLPVSSDQRERQSIEVVEVEEEKLEQELQNILVYMKIIIHLITLCNDEAIWGDTSGDNQTYFFNDKEDRDKLDLIKAFLENLDRYKQFKSFTDSVEATTLANTIIFNLLHPEKDFYYLSVKQLELILSSDHEVMEVYKKNEWDPLADRHVEELQERIAQVLEGCYVMDRNKSWLSEDLKDQITRLFLGIEESITLRYTIHFSIKNGCYLLMTLLHIVSSETTNKHNRESVLESGFRCLSMLCRRSTLFCMQVFKLRPLTILKRLLWIDPKSVSILFYTITEMANQQIQSDPWIFEQILEIFSDLLHKTDLQYINENAKDRMMGLAIFCQALTRLVANLTDKHFKMSAKIKIQQKLHINYVNRSLDFLLRDASWTDLSGDDYASFPALVGSKHLASFEKVAWNLHPDSYSHKVIMFQLSDFIIGLFAEVTDGVECPRIRDTLECFLHELGTKREGNFKSCEKFFQHECGIYFIIGVLRIYCNCFLLERQAARLPEFQADKGLMNGWSGLELLKMNATNMTEVEALFMRCSHEVSRLLSMVDLFRGERLKEANQQVNLDFMMRGLLRVLSKYLKGLLYEKDRLDLKRFDCEGLMSMFIVRKDLLMNLCSLSPEQKLELESSELFKIPSKAMVAGGREIGERSEDDVENDRQVHVLTTLILSVEKFYSLFPSYQSQIQKFSREKPEYLQKHPTTIFDEMESLGSIGLGKIKTDVLKAHDEMNFKNLTQEEKKKREKDQDEQKKIEKMKISNSIQKGNKKPQDIGKRIEAYLEEKRIAVLGNKGYAGRDGMKESLILSMIDEGNDSSSEVIYMSILDWIVTFFDPSRRDTENDAFGNLINKEPAVIQLMVVFGNLMKLRTKARQAFFNMYFNNEIQEEEGPRSYNQKKIGNMFIRMLIESLLSIQDHIKTSIFTGDICTTCEVYFLICTLIREMVKGNLVKLKVIIGQDCLKGKDLHHRGRKSREVGEGTYSERSVPSPFLQNFFDGLIFDKDPASARYSVLTTNDRSDLAWYNIITLNTLTELISGPSKENQNCTVNDMTPIFTMLSRTNKNIFHIMYDFQNAMVSFLSALLEESNEKKTLEMNKSVMPEQIFSIISKHLVNLYNERNNIVTDRVTKLNLDLNFTHGGKTLNKSLIDDYYKTYPLFSTHPSMSIALGLFSILNQVAHSGISSKYRKFLDKKEDEFQEESNKETVVGLDISKLGIPVGNKAAEADEEAEPEMPIGLAGISVPLPSTERLERAQGGAQLPPDDKENNRDHVEDNPKSKIALYGFLSEMTASVEILMPTEGEGAERRHSHVQIFFAKLPKIFMITKKNQDEFLSECSFKDSNSKVLDLMNFVSEYYIEMTHNQEVFSKYPWLTAITREDSFNFYKIVLWIMGLAINLLALFTLLFPEDERKTAFTTVAAEDAMHILLFIMIAISGVSLLLWLLFKYPERVAKEKSRLNAERYLEHQFLPNNLYRAYIKNSLLNDLAPLAYMMHIIATVFTFLFSYAFLSLHLFTIIFISKTTRYVIKSITEHYNQLLMTFFLTLICIYSFSVVVGDLFVNRLLDVEEESPQRAVQLCKSLASCFFYSTDLGIRGGEGVGIIIKPQEQNSPLFLPKVFIDLSFYILVCLVALNIVFGIILDTFAELRDEQQMREFDTDNVCFICGFERKIFEKQEKRFSYHQAVEHNMWSYAFYLIYLRSKDRSEYTGIEYFVAEKFDSRNTDWFPIQNTKYIVSEEDGGLDTIREELEKCDEYLDELILKATVIQRILRPIVTKEIKSNPDAVKEEQMGRPKVDEVLQWKQLGFEVMGELQNKMKRELTGACREVERLSHEDTTDLDEVLGQVASLSRLYF